MIGTAERISALTASAVNCPHGTRARYRSGCKCMLCRAANSRYNCQRDAARKQGDTRDLVDANPARLHLKKLGKLGVGYKSVAAAASIATSVVAKIRSGEKKRIRKHTERAILAVTKEAIADSALVCAAGSWKLLDELIADGYTQTQLAKWLGSKAKVPALQVKQGQVTARTAMKIKRMHAAIQAGKLRRN